MCCYVRDLPPESWTVLSWKIPVMIGGPGYGVDDEKIEVFGGADRLRAQAGDLIHLMRFCMRSHVRNRTQYTGDVVRAASQF
jgi:hypothetical protein